ncbi:glycosyltransferase family 4 protein [Allobranchiibius sp. CTAmp26]|uniref:glycosyltransferase family 4 protein n=1 Tax=Allobranchiibius sp. CTAmp26 TaxID=2815214 RepID=UPI001AA13BD1|nr:glycosyltransferase family 4 protein [Allobranchiibius sp. CTAmp26]MBO1755767.1 glycosyltransferase family 4 protein [Allobranchiibius sp. CTAmp26]
MPDAKARVLVVAGYFDWFSGYQETVLARALARLADTSVLAGNLVSPIFSDDHLRRIGQDRTYEPGTTLENGVSITRLPVRELRSMVWSSQVAKAVTAGDYDLVVQVMPGQLLPAGASLGRARRRVSLYGDNAAMYAGLSKRAARVKFTAFAATKGILYSLVNSRADAVYGYTPDTLERLRWFGVKRTMKLLPLAFDSTVYAFDSTTRRRTRDSLGLSSHDIAIIAAGKIQPQKRLDALVDAVSNLRSEHPNLRLVLVGLDSTDTSRALQDRIEGAGLSDATIMKPFVGASELNALFNAADIGAWPAMPAITIQQAMATGLTTVIPDNSFTSHLLSAGTSALALHGDSLSESLTETLAVAINTRTRTDHERTALADGSAWLCSDTIAAQLLEGAPS